MRAAVPKYNIPKIIWQHNSIHSQNVTYVNRLSDGKYDLKIYGEVWTCRKRLVDPAQWYKWSIIISHKPVLNLPNMLQGLALSFLM